MKQKLINKLQNKVRLLSVNSLGCIYPDDIVSWLEASARDAKDLIDYLHEERIIKYKYRVKCECGEFCTFYENKMIRKKELYCEVCGEEFLQEEIEKNAELIYEIDKEELMDLKEDEVDFKKIPLIHGKIVSVTKGKEEKSMEIFMGSSSQAIDFMEEVALKLEELGTTPLLWNASGKGIFVAGTNTIDALIEITKRVQAAVFIFNGDDEMWNEKSSLDTLKVVRDNVLFEYGLFAGALGKENVCFICKNNPKIASDLKGVTYINGDKGDIQLKLKLKDWVNAIKC